MVDGDAITLHGTWTTRHRYPTNPIAMDGTGEAVEIDTTLSVLG